MRLNRLKCNDEQTHHLDVVVGVFVLILQLHSFVSNSFLTLLLLLTSQFIIVGSVKFESVTIFTVLHVCTKYVYEQ